jgi:energy-coupling factor transporter transmembrane protein EcfT
MLVIITQILLYVVPSGFIGQMILLVIKITCPRHRQIWRIIKALFIRLIIRTFQLVFFFSRNNIFSLNKSTNSVFQPTYQHSRTGQKN